MILIAESPKQVINLVIHLGNPGLIAPPITYFLITLVIRLDRVEKEFRTVVENAGDAIFIHNRDGKIIEVNEAACKSLGYGRGELLALHASDVVAGFDPEMLSKHWGELIQGMAITLENEHRRNDGSTFPVEVSISLLDHGDEFNVLAVARDITKRKRDQKALHDSEEKYRKLVETSHDLIWSVDAEGRFTFVNQASIITHGYDPDEMVGKPFTDFMTAEQAKIDMAIFAKIKDGADFFDLESVHLKKDGSPVYLSFNAVVLRDDSGNVLGTTGTAKDITRRKLAEEQSRRHQEQLAHVTRVATMGEMATGLAHELNQPLAAITAYINGSLRHLKSEDPPSESIIEALEKASEQAIRAGNVIQHLRDFVRRKDSKSENVDINDAVKKAMQLIKADLDSNQVVLTLDLSQPPAAVVGDPILLQQVILNLARNSVDAMKSKDPGSGELTISTSAEDNSFSIGIKDNGPGIDPKHQEQLFDPYFSTKKSGLGLGLPICRSIINEHGGQIWYEPAPINGAAFHIRLPLSKTGYPAE
ncbi:MAG: hypothetical protein CMM10_18645 [Rhodospirillaceae bacterium]|nr:hypothetical protein [Rhodospirillaceae bacterium]